MGKQGVNWDNTETWQRLVASIIASGVKVCLAGVKKAIKSDTSQLDLRQVAKYYGTTYDTLENRLRKVKKDAAVLKEEVETGQRGEVAPTRTKSVTSTPRKSKSPNKDHSALEIVANGRVTKTTPTKKRSIKQEQLENNISLFSSTFTDDPDTSFDHTPINFDLGMYEHSFAHSSLLGTDESFGL